MNVMRIEVSRRQTQGLITKNRMRVDVVADFFVRVGSTARGGEPRRPDAWPAHAWSPDGVRELMEGRFAAALRTAAAQMTLEELHERRQDYAEAREGRRRARGSPRTASNSKASRSSTSTRPASNSSTAPTLSTPKA